MHIIGAVHVKYMCILRVCHCFLALNSLNAMQVLYECERFAERRWIVGHRCSRLELASEGTTMLINI
jgi:hypothetical protein